MTDRYPRVRELLEIALRGLDIAEGRASLGKDVSHDERCVARTLREASATLLLSGERPAPEESRQMATPSGDAQSSGPGQPAANPGEPSHV